MSSRRANLALLLRLGVALAFALPSTAPAQEVRSVLAGADPDAHFLEGQMWIYPTGKGDRLEAWSSSDRVHWADHGTLLNMKDVGWVRADRAPHHYLWAPDMVAANGRYYLYFAVGPQDPTPSRTGVAICSGPAGPCKDSGRPLLTGERGFEAIDPFVFTDPRSGRHLLYSGGSNGATLRVFDLADDMTTVVGELKIDQPPLFTEGAFMHERNGIYYLSYSHGSWNTSGYSVHYAMAPTPLGPWKYRGSILQSDRRFKGPGHHSFVQDPADGSWLIVYHRWEGKHGDGPYEGSRRIAIQPVTYDALGQIEPIVMSDH